MGRTDEVIKFQRVYSWTSSFSNFYAMLNVREVLEWMRWNGYASQMTSVSEENVAFNPLVDVSYVVGKN
jgi:hypothetical protein